MQNFTYGKKKFKIYEGFEEMPMNVYAVAVSVMEEQGEPQNIIDELRLRQSLLPILSNGDLTPSDVDEWESDQVLSLFDMCDYIFREPEIKEMQSFEHNGDVYLLPERVVDSITRHVTHGTNLKWAQYVDYMKLSQDLDELGRGDMEKIPVLIALLCNKQGESYKPEEVHKRAESFKTLSVSTALSCAFFLASSISSSMPSINHYLAEVGKQPQKECSESNA